MSKVKKGLDRLNRYLDLPEGLINGGVHIEFHSNKQALIDGKCSILQYSEDQIRLNTDTGGVSICGKGLCLDTLNREGALISGTIYKLEFM